MKNDDNYAQNPKPDDQQRINQYREAAAGDQHFCTNYSKIGAPKKKSMTTHPSHRYGSIGLAQVITNSEPEVDPRLDQSNLTFLTPNGEDNIVRSS